VRHTLVTQTGDFNLSSPKVRLRFVSLTSRTLHLIISGLFVYLLFIHLFNVIIYLAPLGAQNFLENAFLSVCLLWGRGGGSLKKKVFNSPKG
jgi:hypothetical protein